MERRQRSGGRGHVPDIVVDIDGQKVGVGVGVRDFGMVGDGVEETRRGNWPRVRWKVTVD